MRGEKLSDAIVYNKLNLLKNDFFGYIERNTAKVDANLPVFYGYVISALEQSFPEITDEVYDDFLDSITFKVLDESKNATSVAYIQKVTSSALRAKKRQNADVGINIMIGLTLLKHNHCENALPYLKPYAMMDALLGMAVAYCYQKTARAMSAAAEQHPERDRSGEMELLSRELLIALAKTQPLAQVLPQLNLEDISWLDKPFWQMILAALSWFPEERWFLALGLEKAKKSGNSAMREKLLEIAGTRFYTDITFLREVYLQKLEQRDAGGAAGIINQMMKQFPDNLEPIYYGLKLSLLTTKRITYQSFRKLAISKKMPLLIIELFDAAFEIMSEPHEENAPKILGLRSTFPKMGFFLVPLAYIAQDISSEDPARSKKARKVFMDAIDQISREQLHIP
ncbi:MAG: hypothetical protein ABFC24_05530 [Methanoregulaceae archaeon]